VIAGGDPFASSNPELHVTRFLIPYFERTANILPTDEYRISEGAAIRAAFGQSILEARPDVVLIGRETYAWHVPDLTAAARIPSLLLIQGGTFHAIINAFPQAVREQIFAQFRKTDHIIAVAKHLAESMRRIGFEDVTPIPNPVDTGKFYNRPKDPQLLRRLAISHEQLTIGYVANLRMLKRPMDLMDSAQAVIRHRPDTVFLVVGDGDCRKMMEEACASRSIVDNFRFVGWIDHDLMPSHVNLVDIVVMPSETEGLALVYLETQACERVLIASDIPAAHEVISDRETGLLFRIGDVADLTAKILSVASDPILRAAIGRDARISAMRHDLDRVVAAYEAVIRELAG
jgi:glycosyltransferase involved in cell wall biosynthesis